MLSKAIYSNFKSVSPLATRAMSTAASSQPKRVVVTGAAGQISYSILFRIARYASVVISF